MVLAGPVPLVCWLEKRLKLWHATVLAAVALGSVLSINHFAGDYGIQMLYYRNFIGTPMAPGEMVAHFSIRDYISAFRSGMTLVAGSFLLPFLLAGVSGLFGSTRVRAVVGVTMAYVLLHFLVLPNWEERWFCVFYLSMGLSAAIALKGGSRGKLLLPVRGASAVAGAAEIRDRDIRRTHWLAHSRRTALTSIPDGITSTAALPKPRLPSSVDLRAACLLRPVRRTGFGRYHAPLADCAFLLDIRAGSFPQ